MILLRAKLIIGRITFWVTWPALYFILHGTERTRIILIANQRVLLTRGTLSAGKWSLPGGGIHHGENVAVGACRELYEELGIVLSADQLRDIGVETTHNSGIAYRAHFLIAKIDDCVRPMPSLEVAEAWWVPIPEVQNLRHDEATTRALELFGTY